MLILYDDFCDSNLVSNALKFTDIDGSGKVFIEARQLIKYRNNSSRHWFGMTEQQIKNLFHPRITASFKGTAGEKGAGLGLSLVNVLLKLTKGKLMLVPKRA